MCFEVLFYVMIPFKRKCIFVGTSQYKAHYKMLILDSLVLSFCLSPSKLLRASFACCSSPLAAHIMLIWLLPPPFLEVLLPRSLRLLHAHAINYFSGFALFIVTMMFGTGYSPILLQFLPFSSSTIFFALLFAKSYTFLFLTFMTS